MNKGHCIFKSVFVNEDRSRSRRRQQVAEAGVDRSGPRRVQSGVVSEAEDDSSQEKEAGARTIIARKQQSTKHIRMIQKHHQNIIPTRLE